MKKEIPILFSTPMVLAILARRKTMTRRILSPQPVFDHLKIGPFMDEPQDLYIWNKYGLNKKKGLTFYAWKNDEFEFPYEMLECCPYGEPGDLLWVKETFYAWGYWRQTDKRGKKGRFKWEFVDCTLLEGGHYLYEGDNLNHMGVTTVRDGKKHWYKRPSLFMPKEAARIWLERTKTGVERLQDISGEDAKAEGILSYKGIDNRPRYKDYMADASGYGDPEHDYPTVGIAVTSFCTLWEKINGTESWAANPWVWVVSFIVLSTTGKPAIVYPENHQVTVID